MGIGEPRCDCLELMIFDLGDTLVGDAGTHGTDSETQQVETKNGFQRGRLGRQIELLSYDESPSIGNRASS